MIKIAPSILNADFSCLQEELKKINKADYIHLDVMDGHFVPNITFGPGIIESIRPLTSIKFDTHLMIDNPEKYIDNFADAGSDIITIHQESTVHLDRLINQVKSKGCKVGVALNPATSLRELDYVLEDIDMVLIMSVNPGFGGQKFIPGMLNKISKLKEIINKNKLDINIEVDGGINLSNIQDIVKAGTDIIVTGSAVFKSKDPVQALSELKKKSMMAKKEV